MKYHKNSAKEHLNKAKKARTDNASSIARLANTQKRLDDLVDQHKSIADKFGQESKEAKEALKRCHIVADIRDKYKNMVENGFEEVRRHLQSAKIHKYFYKDDKKILVPNTAVRAGAYALAGGLAAGGLAAAGTAAYNHFKNKDKNSK